MNANLGTQFTPDAGQPIPPASVVAQTVSYDTSMRMIGGISHDVEDHDISEAGSNPAFDSSVYSFMSWGPNGHPTVSRLMAPATGEQYDHYLHWNQNQILYSTTPGNVVDDVKLGGLGDLLPGDPSGALNLWDRDFTGVAVANRNGTGQGSSRLWAYGSMCGALIQSPATASSGYVAPSSADSSTCATTGRFVQPRTDGYFNGTDFVNGVRSYYSGAGSWTSPDALGGSTPFAYAGNNAVTFDDPTGLYSAIVNPSCAAAPGSGRQGTFGRDMVPHPSVQAIENNAIGICSSSTIAGDFENLILNMRYVEGVLIMSCAPAPSNTRFASVLGYFPASPESGINPAVGVHSNGLEFVYDQSKRPGMASHWTTVVRNPIGVKIGVTFTASRSLFQRQFGQTSSVTAVCEGTYPFKRVP